MKFKSLFLPIISLATVVCLVEAHPVSAQKAPPRLCPGPRCLKIPGSGSGTGGGWIPNELLQVNVLISQGKFIEAEGLLLKFIEQAESTQNLNREAAARQVLADVYTRMGKLELVPIQLDNAEALYQKSGNSAGSRDVQLQRRQIQRRQIQLQRIQLQQRQLQQR